MLLKHQMMGDCKRNIGGYNVNVSVLCGLFMQNIFFNAYGDKTCMYRDLARTRISFGVIATNVVHSGLC